MKKITIFLMFAFIFIANNSYSSGVSLSDDRFKGGASSGHECLAFSDGSQKRVGDAANQGYADNKNPAADLFGCFLQLAFEGPTSILSNHCGCMTAVVESCLPWEWDEGSIVGASLKHGASESHCMGFAPHWD